MEFFLDILKLTIPALVVFATAYFLLKQHLDNQYKTSVLSLKAEAQKITLPLRLQAYERFALLCDRISIPNLILRLQTPDMTVRDLRATMMIAVRQELDHNVSQQIYLSDTLWQIISFSIEDTLSQISSAGELLPADADSSLFVDALFKNFDNHSGMTSLQKAISAIRTEMASHF